MIRARVTHLLHGLASLLFGVSPATPADMQARREARVLREKMLDDRLSQKSGAGEIYRSGGR